MGRRSVWSNAEIIAIAERCVPAADEVWRLQNDDDPECRWFRRVVTGTDAPHPGTLQGTYVFAPGGELLGRINSYSAEQTREMIARALAKWSELPAEMRRLPAEAAVAPRFRWESSYPEDGLALLRTVRDLPADGDPTAERAVAFNVDAVWLSAREARSLVPDDLAVGASAGVDPAIAQRLATLVFVDNVRGQTQPYHPSEVEIASLRAEVTGVDDDVVELHITGETRAASEGPWRYGDDSIWKPKHEAPHALETRVFGRATFDRSAQRFTAFEAIALGTRTGATWLNGRGRDPEPGGIGFVLQLAPAHWRVAPTFIDVYDADWVRRPE